MGSGKGGASAPSRAAEAPLIWSSGMVLTLRFACTASVLTIFLLPVFSLGSSDAVGGWGALSSVSGGGGGGALLEEVESRTGAETLRRGMMR